jgi:hypothetical protein
MNPKTPLSANFSIDSLGIPSDTLHVMKSRLGVSVSRDF